MDYSYIPGTTQMGRVRGLPPPADRSGPGDTCSCLGWPCSDRWGSSSPRHTDRSGMAGPRGHSTSLQGNHHEDCRHSPGTFFIHGLVLVAM